MSLYSLNVGSGSTGSFHDSTSGTFTNFLPQIPLYLSFDLAVTRTSGTDVANLLVQINWKDSSGAALTQFNRNWAINATSDALQKVQSTPPAGAVSGYLYIKVTPGASGVMQHEVWIKKLRLGKTELSATNGAQAGTNLTDSSGNPLGDSSILNTAVALGSNFLINSDFSNLGNNSYGWTGSWAGNVTGGTTTWGTNFAGGGTNYFGQLNVGYAVVNNAANPGSVGQVFDSLFHLPDPNQPEALANLQRWALPVYDGDRVFAAAFIAAHRCQGSLMIQWYNGSGYASGFGGYVGGDVQGAYGGRAFGGINGDPANFDRLTLFATAPAGARYAVLRVRSLTAQASTDTNSWVFYTQMMLAKVPAGQTTPPPYSPGPTHEMGADVTTSISGPASSNVLYDSSGTSFQSADDLIYSCRNGQGVVTSGVTMTYQVLSGTFNGFTYASGAQTLVLSSGVAGITPTSISTSTATIQINATYNGRALPALITTVNKQLALAAATGTSGGGAGSTDVASQTSGFTSINTGTFTTITQTLKFTMPTGKTTLQCVVNLNGKYPPTANQQGPFHVEFQVLRGGVAQGTVQGSNPDNTLNYEPETGRTISSAASLQYTLPMTGLVAGTQYSITVQARVTSTPLPTNANMLFSGSVTLSAP